MGSGDTSERLGRSPMVELADIFRRSGPASRAQCADRLPTSHLAAMAAIAPCRTEALGGMSPSARRAESWSTATMLASIGIVPSARTTRPHVGSHSHAPCSCLSRIVSSPLRSQKHSGPWPARTSSLSPPCSCRPPLPLCQPSPWPPNTLVARAGWWGACTPGRGNWRTIRMCMTSCLAGRCRSTPHSGSAPP
jgi:hypothetical protein